MSADQVFQLPDNFFRLTKEYISVKSLINRKVLKNISRNAYRILDLSIDASEDEILEKAEAIKKKVRLGIKEHRSFGVDLLEDIEIDEKMVLAATSRLMNPKTRLYERLFWFSSITDCPISECTERYTVLKDYLKIFYDITRFTKIVNIQALFNLPLLGLIFLVLDDYYLQSKNSWLDVYSLLFFVINNDDYCQYLHNIEDKGHFSKRIGHQIEDAKNDIYMLLIEPLQALIEEHLRNNRLNAVINGLKIISEINIPNTISNDITSYILYMLEDEITTTCNGIIDDCHKKIKHDSQSIDSNRDICNLALELYDNKVSPKFKIVTEYSNNPLQVNRIKEYLAEFYYSLAILFTWGEDYGVANKLLQKARNIVVDNSAQRVKIDELINKIKPYVEYREMKSSQEEKGQDVDNNSENNEEYVPNFVLVDDEQVKKRHDQEISVTKLNNKPKSFFIALAIITAAIVVLAVIIFYASKPPANQTTTTANEDEYVVSYDGQRKNGVPHGRGTMVFSDGFKYTGEFYEGNFHGQGTLTGPDGFKYVGSWQEGVPSGWGYYEFADGTIIEGTWRDYENSLGSVTTTYPDGSVETGQIINWEFYPD